MSPSEITYAGVTQSRIVDSLTKLSAFIGKINIEGVEVLKENAATMMAADGYVERIAKATTPEELAKATSNYPHQQDDMLYAARAFEHVLQTYAGIKKRDTDPLCNEAYEILGELRAWGGMPWTSLSAMTSQDYAAQAVFTAKEAIIEAGNGMFSVLPPHKPQLAWEFYFHPKKGESRDALAAAIDTEISDIKKKNFSLSSEFTYNAHRREGTISKVAGSRLAIKTLEIMLAAKGMLDDRSVECAKDPVRSPPIPEDAGFDHHWISTYSYRPRR